MFVHYQFFHERSTGHEDLAPYRIGTVKGYINTDEIDSAPYLKKVEADRDLENLKKPLNRDLDLIVIDKLAAQSLIAARPPEATGQLEFMDPPLIIHPLFVVFPRSLPRPGKLCDGFNKGLEMIAQDDTVERIMSRSGLVIRRAGRLGTAHPCMVREPEAEKKRNDSR